MLAPTGWLAPTEWLAPVRSLDLRGRVVAAVAAIAVLQVIVGVIVIEATSDQLLDQVDERLAAATGDGRSSAFDLSDDHHDEDHEEREDHSYDSTPTSALERLGDTYEGMLAADGSLTTFFAPNSRGEALSPPRINVQRAAAATRKPVTVDSVDDDFHYRLAATSRGESRYIITAIPLNDVEVTIAQLTTLLVGSGIAILVALALIAWWVVRLGVAPIKRMTASAEAIANGDLSRRIEDTDERTEAGQLGCALNTMLGQIETSLAERTQAEQRLRQFIADASHELRTPVATIRGYAELYGDGALDDRAELDDAMRRTRQESERMTRLISDMLNLAKLDRNPSLTTKPVELGSLVTDAVADAGATHPERSVTAPTPARALVVDGDEDLLRQVLSNLIGNAIVHTDDGTAVRVSLSEDNHRGVAVLEVADDGDGMTPEVAARVTERFFRADPSRSRHRGGSGLGLALVDSIVSAHRGTLAVTSEPGRGTTVTITLPLNEATLGTEAN